MKYIDGERRCDLRDPRSAAPEDGALIILLFYYFKYFLRLQEFLKSSVPFNQNFFKHIQYIYHIQ